MSAPRRAILETSEDIAQVIYQDTVDQANIFPTEVKRSSEAIDHRPVAHYIQVAIEVGGGFYAAINIAGQTDVFFVFNNNVVLQPDTVYIFPIIVVPNMTYNVAHSAGVNRNVTCQIFETDDLIISQF